MPVVAAALIVILGVLALVVDRLWLDAVKSELRSAAEAAALAGARALADDDRLKPDHPPEAISRGAAWMASKMAGRCSVAGRPLELEMDRDVSVGAYAASATTGERELLTNVADPRTVVVLPAFLKNRGNPLALLIRGLHGPDVAELTYRAEASVDNRVRGVRPLDGSCVPALPIAILRRELTDERRPSWETDIESRKGADNYGFDLETLRIVDSPDGIPEIELTAGATADEGREANLAVLGLGNELRGSLVAGQIAKGLDATDLERTGGELSPDRASFETAVKYSLSTDELDALDALRGEARLVLLYSETGTGGSVPRVRCERLVAGRVVAVRRNGAGPPKLVLQPAVVATRTALTMLDETSAGESGGSREGADSNVAPNKYVYHLGLSR